MDLFGNYIAAVLLLWITKQKRLGSINAKAIVDPIFFEKKLKSYIFDDSIGLILRLI